MKIRHVTFVDRPARDNVLFVEEVRLLDETHAVIAISLVIAGLSAAGVRQLVPVGVTGVCFASSPVPIESDR